MLEREIPALSDNDSATKIKILNTATRLFAVRGFSAVSMKDIAEDVGIKASSIYNHYVGKDALLEDILVHFQGRYRSYFDWLMGECENASSVEQVMDIMFKELIEVYDELIYYGISLALSEQHNNEAACKFVVDLFYKDSISFMQSIFDDLVEKKVIPPVDTKIIATLFMFCVLIGNDMRVHEFRGAKLPIDCTEMYISLKSFIALSLKNGAK